MRKPKAFNTRPFPKVEIRIQPLTQKIGGIIGERSFYRIVRYHIKAGNEHEIWVNIDILGFFFIHRIRWRNHNIAAGA